MNGEDLAQEVLEICLDALKNKPEEIPLEITLRDRKDDDITLSSSGKGARYLAHVLAGTDFDPSPARTQMKFDIGDLIHEYLREVLILRGENQGYRITHMEEPVRSHVPSLEKDYVGHIDGILWLDDSPYLLDIKVTDHYSYVTDDPRNPDVDDKGKERTWWQKAHLWRSGLYTFDAVAAWADDAFKRNNLYQLASYEDAVLNDLGIELEGTVFVYVNRNMCHLAVGYYVPTDSQWESWLDERDENIEAAVKAEKPEDLDTCWPAEVGAAPHIVCQYCRYSESCYDLDVTTYKGKPRMKIRSIK